MKRSQKIKYGLFGGTLQRWTNFSKGDNKLIENLQYVYWHRQFVHMFILSFCSTLDKQMNCVINSTTIAIHSIRCRELKILQETSTLDRLSSFTLQILRTITTSLINQVFLGRQLWRRAMSSYCALRHKNFSHTWLDRPMLHWVQHACAQLLSKKCIHRKYLSCCCFVWF